MQIWYHRRAIVEEILKRNGWIINRSEDGTVSLSRNHQIDQFGENLDSVDEEFFEKQARLEIQFTDALMNESDKKNIHAWNYRRFIVQVFGLWDTEVNFTETLLMVRCHLEIDIGSYKHSHF